MDGVTVEHDRCHREKKREEVEVERGWCHKAGIKRVMRRVGRARGEVRYDGSMARESPVRGRSKCNGRAKAWRLSSEVRSDWGEC
jgi:hypothetical protein